MVWLLFHDVQVGASGLRAGERLEEALLEFSAAIALQPRYGKALANRANLLSATGRYAEAMADANMAAEAMPEKRRYAFLSVFKWEWRKGWDVLLNAYWGEFSINDLVVLRLRTFKPHWEAGHEQIYDWLKDAAAQRGTTLQRLPPVRLTLVSCCFRLCGLLPSIGWLRRLSLTSMRCRLKWCNGSCQERSCAGCTRHLMRLCFQPAERAGACQRWRPCPWHFQ